MSGPFSSDMLSSLSSSPQLLLLPHCIGVGSAFDSSSCIDSVSSAALIFPVRSLTRSDLQLLLLSSYHRRSITAMTPNLQRAVSPSSSPSSPSLFPPKPPPHTDHGHEQLRYNILRRDLAALAILAIAPTYSLARPPPATAFSIGISGPKEWLKEQKRKSSRFLLAPIDASRQILRAAYVILNRDSDYTNQDLEEVQTLFRSAARDCVPQERSSFVNFQANTGVEVCTFKLIVKNAASLLGDRDPVKLEAEAILDNLIRSFSSLNGLASEMDLQLVSNSRQKVVDALMNTVSSLDQFEQGIKDCLEV